MKLAHKNRITANHHTNPNSLILRDLILKEKYLLKDLPTMPPKKYKNEAEEKAARALRKRLARY